MSQLGVGDLLVRSFALYRSNLLRLLAMTLPVAIVVTGVTALGLGELGAHYHTSISRRDAYIDTAAALLVTVPLINSILARWVLLEVRGERIGSAEVLASAFETFPRVLLVVVVWWAAVAAGLVVVVLSIYLFVSWYFVVQAVVIDGDRGLAPIARSAALVRGNWWRSFGIGLCFVLIVVAPRQLIVGIFDSFASSANSYAVVVAGEIISDALLLPFLAIGATLYYLDLRAAAASA